ncbi:MAG: LytTR family DNA-binding domain-containing protein [Flavobacteriales bacterium]|jgi:DNA-binding LytR/AlgR family response regulator|nr:LytTR family DNA-binding domain-containing protein [Flavobacteriales bacterium]
MDCIIIEDYLQTRILLESYIKNHKELELSMSLSNFRAHISEIKKQPEALLILDIELGGEQALDILKETKLSNPILFVTGHQKYAYDALQQNIYGYLLKPIEKVEFDQKINKISQKIDAEKSFKKEDHYLFIRSQFRLIKLKINSIIYIESDRDYLIFHTEKESIKSLMRLSDIIHPTFVRTHKSYLVNQSYVQLIYKNSIQVGSHEIPIGRAFKKTAYQKLLNEN